MDKLGFLIEEAFTALRRNILMTFAAVSTVAISLFLLGGLGYAYVQLSSYVATFPDRLDMRVFLEQGTTAAQISETAKEIRHIHGVKNAAWIPKEKAWELEKKKYPPELVADLDNPIPDAFKVTITSPDMGGEVAAAISRIHTVKKESGVVYMADILQLAGDAMGVIRWLGLSVGGLLFVTAGLLIYNAIRLTVLSRRLEIRIMQLVGASLLTIRVPFLLEGVFQGVAGGLIAAVLLKGAHFVFSTFLEKNTAQLHGLGAFPFGPMTLLLCVAGASYGLLCSSVAVRTPLRFR